MDRQSPDLNLLVALEALLRERSVTRAARCVGLSQPAMSRALARLRNVLGDPLLVRVGHRMVLTEQASQLVERSERLSREVMEFLAPPVPFEPGTSTRTFRIVATDYVQLRVLTGVQGLLARQAPRVTLLVLPFSAQPFTDLLRGGEVDLALGLLPSDVPGTELYRAELFTEAFVGLARKGHPLIRRGQVELGTYASLTHVMVSPRGTAGGIVDTELEKHGLRRHVALTVPSFLLAPHIVAASDHVCTISQGVAATFCELLPLRTFELPIALPSSAISMIWHARTHHDPACRWLRELIHTCSASGSQRPSPGW